MTPAIVLHPYRSSRNASGRSVAARLEEAERLASSIDLEIAAREAIRLPKIRAASYFGVGVMERLRELVEACRADVVVVDAALSPVQQRTLEGTWDVKVIDRTGLILEIFGARARTREGLLQVELAHLTYQRSRLVRSWTHLERQRGGFGFLGGPGETQIESDRRMISERLTKIRSDLETVKRTRSLQRRSRRRNRFPVAALVGYTNAGKSALFNRLTEARVIAKDQLFATLDPTMRAVRTPGGRTVLLTDTVGFVSDLPTTLIAAFRATLEEVVEADVLIHVRDVAHPDSEHQKGDVERVLGELGVAPGQEQGYCEVLNKIDLLDDESLTVCHNMAKRNTSLVPLSAATGENCTNLLCQLDRLLAPDRVSVAITLKQADGASISWLYRNATVLQRENRGEYAHLEVTISRSDLSRFERYRESRSLPPDLESVPLRNFTKQA